MKFSYEVASATDNNKCSKDGGDVTDARQTAGPVLVKFAIMDQLGNQNDCVKVPIEDVTDPKVFVVDQFDEEKYNEQFKSKISIFGYPFFKIKWSNVIWLLICHILAVIGYAYCIINGIYYLTLVWVFFIGAASGFGMVIGGHRFWSHRSFKARWPLRLVLIICQTVAVNGSVMNYSRDHRVHHKCSDSPADPKNSRRGFFYSHMGWWLLKKDAPVIREGKKFNFDDLWNDWFVRTQHRFYRFWVVIFAIVIPAAVPYFVWHENIYNSVLVCVFLRYTIIIHHFWTTNSLLHLWGDNRDYDQQMRPVDSRMVNYISMGEGHHNFHHTFPYDYVSSTEGWRFIFDPSALIIDIAALLGLAYDLKKVAPDVLEQRVKRTGRPENLAKKRRPLWVMIVLGILDWLAGIVIVAWPLWLGIVLRALFLLVTRGSFSWEAITENSF